jgi:hypothetical protein
MDLALAVKEKSRGFKPLLAPIGEDEGVTTLKVIWVDSGRKRRRSPRGCSIEPKKQHAPEFSSPHMVIFLRPYFWEKDTLFFGKKYS